MTGILLACAVLVAGSGAVTHDDPPPIDVTRTGAPDAWIRPDEGIELVLSRPLASTGERLAIVIGNEDWTDFFALDGRRFDYRPGPVRLPPGESVLTVYVVTAPNTWRQVASIPLKVTTPSGFESVTLGPRVELSDTGLLGQARTPAAGTPAPHAQDATLGFGLRTEHVRDGITIATQTNLLGVTNEAKAPRFAALGAAAPQLDLADYTWTIEHQRFKVAMGQGTFGTERHLAPGLPSRGLSLTVRRGRADVSVAAFSGTAIVGFDNFAGVSTAQNRVGLAQIGFELLPRAGASRIEVSALDGERLPQAGFTQARVSDAERSHGTAFRFLGSGLGQRLRVDTGLARSTFTNPPDPLLDQQVPTVAVKPRTNDAVYIDTSFDVLKSRPVGKAGTLTITPTYRLERVDPLFASVGAPQGLRSDLFQNVFGVAGSIGSIAGNIVRTVSYDNLRRVPSILRTDTGLVAANVAVPTGSFGQSARAAQWWPTMTYTMNRSTQVGEDLPQNGGFKDASQVPNQLNAVHTLRADWSFARAHTGYFATRSTQDNRQPGRERADFATLVQGLSLGGSLGTRADVNADIGLERALSKESNQLTRTGHLTLTGSWRTTGHDTVTTIVNATIGRGPDGAINDANDATLQYAHAFVFPARGVAKPRVQLFSRVTRQATTTFQPLADAPADRRHVISFSVGLTCAVF